MILALDDFDAILGIDQTGAVKPNGQPKSLPVALVKKHSPHWALELPEGSANHWLRSLELSELKEFFENFHLDLFAARILIVVDSVIGLPKEFQTSEDARSDIREWIQKASKHPGFGAKTAEVFFDQILKNLNKKQGAREILSSYPQREVEIELSANSVFTSRPYQKNIQTGTFRVWKELSTKTEVQGFEAQSTLELVKLWPFEKIRQPGPGTITLAEGYPTLAWRLLNGTSRGKPLNNLPKEQTKVIGSIQNLKGQSPDHQDALMLALLAHHLIQKSLFIPPETHTIEGDILGAKSQR